jgi:uncharacterized protein
MLTLRSRPSFSFSSHRAAAPVAPAPGHEIRSFRAIDLRAVKGDGGAQYLEGRAASYNVLSSEMWGWYERIVPGAFSRAVKDGQDVRHLINHDANLILGRTKSGTLQLTEDDKGLSFRTLVPKTSYASDLVVSVDRGDIDECSFAFVAVNTAWIEEPDPENDKEVMYVRELRDLDLFDISTVTYPAYPETNTELNSRAARDLPPDAPKALRSRILRRRSAGQSGCACPCDPCAAGNCADCSAAICTDENCRCGGMRALRLRLAQAAL